MVDVNKLNSLTVEGKQQIALALLLLRDFKAQEQPVAQSTETFLYIMELANMLGVNKELEELIPQLPPFEIRPRKF